MASTSTTANPPGAPRRASTGGRMHGDVHGAITQLEPDLTALLEKAAREFGGDDAPDCWPDILLSRLSRLSADALRLAWTEYVQAVRVRDLDGSDTNCARTDETLRALLGAVSE